MKKTAIFISMICFIVQPLLVLANEPSPPPGFTSIQEYNYATLCSTSNPMPGCGRESTYNQSSDWRVGEVILGIGALWFLGQMAKGASSSSSKSSNNHRANH